MKFLTGATYGWIPRGGAISRMCKLMFLGLTFASFSTPALSGSVVYIYDAAGNRVSDLTIIP
ncbi:hypothetical protein [Nitrosovibrio sp. Nv17]|uniref:hypothetical protein n=1 Tax=Nitrosovibrio sp. Nv17 TaxID=1855339 RepID=UPI000908E37B|nr:hypothetical protein [Nitrosovibrio sp. Nv17]SFW36182.1 hypothetical protein SAMN05216414_12352 [Nitrosovibrio sp. Nv17]